MLVVLWLVTTVEVLKLAYQADRDQATLLNTIYIRTAFLAINNTGVNQVPCSNNAPDLIRWSSSTAFTAMAIWSLRVRKLLTNPMNELLHLVL
jgi:hypothetical protein